MSVFGNGRGSWARRLWRIAAGCLVAAVGVALLGGATAVRAAGEPAAPAEQGATPIDQMDLTTPHGGMAVAPSPEKPAEKSPFLRDTKFGLQVRTYYFSRDKYDDSRSEAWTLGGSISYKSGYLADRLALGAVVYTSQPLYAPDEHDGTLLLKPGQEGYTVLGQAYGEVRLADRVFAAIGRKEYDTPYMNKNDVRMTPNTFEGITAYGKAGGKDGAPEWRVGGGYITKIKERNSDEFVWMSQDAGAPAGVERGVYLAAANYKAGEFSLGGAEYYSDDIINIAYAEAKYGLKLGDASPLKLAAQYSDQRSTGDDLLKGEEFSTSQWGARADLGFGGATLTLGYTDTASGADMQSPWSGYPGYTSVQVQDFNRANEQAIIVKGLYDFSRHGAEGLSAYALWVHGSGREAPAYNEDEVDLNLQWTLKSGALKGTSLRVRYANVMQDGGGDPEINDFRIIVNYDL
jgi:hypothetical protein